MERCLQAPELLPEGVATAGTRSPDLIHLASFFLKRIIIYLDSPCDNSNNSILLFCVDIYVGIKLNLIIWTALPEVLILELKLLVSKMLQSPQWLNKDHYRLGTAVPQNYNTVNRPHNTRKLKRKKAKRFIHLSCLQHIHTELWRSVFGIC